MTAGVQGVKHASHQDANQDNRADKDHCEKPKTANQANHAHPQESFHNARERLSTIMLLFLF